MKNKIEQLKKEKNAVILAHYYAPDEAQQVADFVGDSFYLAKVAKESTADIIVFCGVSFMGESVKTLASKKKVLMPDITADCPMAHMVSNGIIEEMKKKYDDLAVVCYINSTAQLKCQSDVCVTSSNAVKIVKSLKNKNIFFIPDKNLGNFVARQIPEKNIILNNGCCPIHTEISAEDIIVQKQAHKNAVVLAHPECSKDVLLQADFIGSTSEMIDFATKSEAKEFIVCTEIGVEFKLNAENKNKSFYFPIRKPCCKDMKLNTLENILKVLETENNEVQISEEVRKKAIIPLNKMLEMTGKK